MKVWWCPYFLISSCPNLPGYCYILKAALAEYNLEQTNASLLRSLGNSTYKVIADDEKCFSLRIYSPDNFDEAQVSSELTWLRFLSSENSIAECH
ncbi:hypothetical protein SD80_022770 [Scytonema tolypothrichoides VB-61278]|nr:hypothetical protein SD80_022770 [Scytonema tolypothrichoides VB-61278]